MLVIDMFTTVNPIKTIAQTIVVILSCVAVFSSIQAQNPTPQTTSRKSDAIKLCKQGKVRQAEVGKSLIGEIKPGEIECWGIHLEKGQYMHAVVNQHGIDVVVTLYGAQESPLVVTDSPNEQDGPEPVSEIADAPTDYLLAVSSEDTKPKLMTYQFFLEELRPATPTDRDYIVAERAFLKAQLANANAGNLEERSAVAMKAYLEVVKDFEIALSHLALEEPRAQAITKQIYEPKALIHNKLGVWYYDSKDLPNGKVHFQKMLTICQDPPIPDCQAAALIMLGNIYSDSRDIEKARESYEAVESLGSAIDQASLRAPTLDKLGDVYQAKRDYLKAVEAYESSAKLYDASQIAGSKDREAIVLTKIGQSYFNLSLFIEARNQYLRSLAVAGTNADTKANALYNLGVTLGILGEWKQAITNLEQADTLTPASDTEQRSYILHSQGINYALLGRPKRGLVLVQQAFDLNQGRYPDAEAWELVYLGFINYKIGDRQKGRELTEKAIRKWEELDDPGGLANALVTLGMGAFETDKDLAMTYLEKALPLQVKAHNRFAQGYTITNMAHIYAERGETDKARNKYHEALAIRTEVGDRSGEVETRYLLARLEDQLGHLEEAQKQLQKAVEQIEYLHLNIPGEDLRASYLSTTVKVFDFLADILMRLGSQHPGNGYAERALEISDSAKARTLLNLLTYASVNLQPSNDPELIQLLEQKKTLNMNLSVSLALRYSLSGAKAPGSAAAVAAEKKVDQLADAWRKVQDQIEARDPRSGLLRPKLLSLAEIRELLDEESLFLEFAIGSERSYLWVVSPNAAVPVRAVELPGQRELERVARDFIDAISHRPTPNKILRRSRRSTSPVFPAKSVVDGSEALSKMLFSKVADLVADAKRLVIVGDGILNYVPFAALGDPMKTAAGGAWVPLLVNHEITLLPSASALAAQRKLSQERATTIRPIAMFAKPLYTTNPLSSIRSVREDPGGRSVSRATVSLAPLVFADDEIKGVDEAVRSAAGVELKTWTGPDVNRRNATDKRLEDYQIIHYSTHGIFDGSRPEGSGLLLSVYGMDRRQGQDYFLGLSDIYGMRLSADLVVLSACESALGAEVKGEGVVGLTRGFMYAGASRVVSSLWVVNDARTAALMGQFYEEMFKNKLPPAAALREAQLFMYAKLNSPPYFWAGFQFQGEWGCATMVSCTRSAGR